jgi:3-methyladenine DNA glycosylase AlkD
MPSSTRAGATAELRAIRRDIRKVASPQRAASHRWFFKTGPGEYGEGDKFLGVTVPEVRRLARQYDGIPLTATTALLKSAWHEERMLALLILVRQYARGDRKLREAIHRIYLRHTRWINNWDLVDCSAAQIVGAHLGRDGRSTLTRLAKSRSVWERRIAIIATYHSIKQREFAHALAIAALLRDDGHDLIHKAVGWMLREIGNRNRSVEERFLRTHARRMPRTMLRYAIERFPEPLRLRYLKPSGV